MYNTGMCCSYCAVYYTHWTQSSFSPEGGAYSSSALKQMVTNIYFPKTDGVTFEQANATQIIGEHFKHSQELPGSGYLNCVNKMKALKTFFSIQVLVLEMSVFQR